MCTSTELSTVDVHRVVAELAKQNESLACLRLAKAWVVRGVLVGHTSLNSSVCQKLLAGRVKCFTPYDPRRRNGGFKQRQHEDCKRKTSTTHNIDDCDEKRRLIRSQKHEDRAMNVESLLRVEFVLAFPLNVF